MWHVLKLLNCASSLTLTGACIGRDGNNCECDGDDNDDNDNDEDEDDDEKWSLYFTDTKGYVDCRYERAYSV